MMPAAHHLATPTCKRRREKRDRQQRAIPAVYPGVGTIDDKTGNYRRTLGTIADGKTRTKYRKKEHEIAAAGPLPGPTRNDYGRRFGPRLEGAVLA